MIDPAVRAAARCLALDAETVTVCAALAAADIPAIVLKGPGLAHRLGLGHRRHYSDVDLLVSPTAFDRAEATLAALGLRSGLPGGRPDGRVLWHERPWRTAAPTPLTVDLHRGFHGVGDPEAFWVALAASAERLPLAGGSVLVPGVEATALLVALHAAVPGTSDKPYADLVRALAVFPAPVWSAAADLAYQAGAMSSFALGLRLVPDGARLATGLRLPTGATPAELLRARRNAPVAYVLARCAERGGVGARMRHLAAYAFPPPAAMRHHSTLARRGWPGLAAAYGQRLLARGARIPRALVELVGAYRAAGRTRDG
ncbi:nucleotidyltransferase family protein [Micromonospora endophytica]|uniref:Uncharacterized protein n=1 Tax=Micromonospora endophytica TaxID=515350 RepID=A0A2W2CFI8_9ACTN|nr:nucleotidyltransferase family protein [Micromonospora endophytica]PZF87079.1 hypothetical protein C1I93_26765 [Micromonospora endophytica]RIW41643.1 hypothetical protein D3H59_25430 [Micromonospora endophytica]BCJ62921.1 hypothetical protein Jiend_63430 [Micromonospora endophytica]